MAINECRGGILASQLLGESITGLQTTLVHHHLLLPVVGVPVGVVKDSLAVLLVGVFPGIAADLDIL